jgi:glycosyltransferase involved in cell wall biosynthesis
LTRGEAEGTRSSFKIKKIFIVPNGVEDYLLEAAEKLPPVDLGSFSKGGDLVLGFVGRIDVHIKGLDLLFDALAKLKSQSAGTKCKLFIIGTFHRKKDERFICSAIEMLGLEDDVKLLGPKYGEEKLRYFLACDVFVHTSRSEGMPMSVLEAMALGRPCLVTPETNMADVVREGGGWECEPEPVSIAAALKTICERKDSLEVRGRLSHELIQEQFTWRKVAKQLYKEYIKICNVSA